MHVVGAFGRLRKARDASESPERIEVLRATGDELMRISLMPHVEDELVGRAIHDGVARKDELDHAEARADVAAVVRRGVDDLLANLMGETCELIVRERLKIGRRLDRVKQANNHRRKVRQVYRPASPSLLSD